MFVKKRNNLDIRKKKIINANKRKERDGTQICNKM